ncbi:SAM-dependent methyltransferase [Rhodocyclus tenuis]|uniref:SAM-dependent methyltransferase n=1 Tax=Rhodocyclus tenuis TaxID=1066 RepID=UPI001290EDEB|nr:SAM-dependent methyltransferase [Rhodocyclus tenuis]
MKIGTLYLIPVPLGPTAPVAVLPATVLATAQSLAFFVAENAKSARAFLKSLPVTRPLAEIAIHELNEHTRPADLPALLQPLLSGNDVGLVSEAGCPGVADPGAALVELAHQHAIRVVPLVGPSSLLLALMASGLCGQQFAFHGYLPVKDEARAQRLRELERESRRQVRTQIFIETPYRNRQLFAAMLAACAETSRLCIAADITLPSEYLATRTLAEWRRLGPPDIERRPAVFLLQA